MEVQQLNKSIDKCSSNVSQILRTTFTTLCIEQTLMIENLEIREFENSVMRQELVNNVQKEIRMASWTAKERLEQFLKDFSILENRIPHLMIASYLGITNISFSRLPKQC
jgi:hypothetical protein